MSFVAAVHAKAVEIAKLSVEITTAAESGHPSTALSLAHLITVLMYHQMRWNPKNPWDQISDRLVLSEGHAVPIVYAAYADLGGMLGRSPKDAHPCTRDDIMQLRDIHSPIDGHPHPQVGFPFADAATGSLGQGLSVAAGLAAAAKADKLDRLIYCIIGDGESREGQIWEAADFIVDHALTNCVPIFNCNELAQSDWVSPQQSAETLHKKLDAFGFITRTIDGHDPAQIKKALNELHVIRNGARPLALVARTVKGWGSLSEQGMGHHGTPVKSEKLAATLKELDDTGKEVLAGHATDKEADAKLLVPPAPKPATHSAPTPTVRLNVEEAFEAAGILETFKANKPLAPRKAYGAALLALASADSRVVGLDADVKNSTHAEWLAKKIPAQFLECRIAEQNMISVAAGLSAAGKIPFCSTFAKFFVRAYDQIEMAIISGANLKLTGTHAGVTLAADGPSQMSLPDVAFFRSFCHVTNFNGAPAIRYFFPADAISTLRCTELMHALDGACYLRALRADTKTLYKPTDTFEQGGYKLLREGKNALIITAGYLVHEALKLADDLAKSGKSVGVVDAYALPFSADTAKSILDLASRHGNRILTVEDNYAGGLEAEIASLLAQSGSDAVLKPLYVAQIPKSGRTPADVLTYLHLDAPSIAAAL